MIPISNNAAEYIDGIRVGFKNNKLLLQIDLSIHDYFNDKVLKNLINYIKDEKQLHSRSR